MATTLTSTIASHFNKETFSDVILTLEKDQKIFAHKFVLAATSAKFAKLLFEEKAEVKDGKITLNLEKVDGEALQAVLEGIYKGELPSTVTISNIDKVIAVATEYDIPIIKTLASGLFQDVTEESCATMINAIGGFGGTLTEKLSTFIGHHIEPIIEKKYHLLLSAKGWGLILQLDTLEISEIQLFNAVLGWAKQEVKKESLEESPENIKKVLGSLLNQIRFPIMSMSEVVSIVLPSKLIDEKDLLELTKYCAMAASVPDTKLPEKLPFSNVKRKGLPTVFHYEAMTINHSGGKTVYQLQFHFLPNGVLGGTVSSNGAEGPVTGTYTDSSVTWTESELCWGTAWSYDVSYTGHYRQATTMQGSYHRADDTEVLGQSVLNRKP